MYKNSVQKKTIAQKQAIALKKIVVLISGNGSNLQALIDAIQAQQLHGEIVCVISNNPDAYGLTRAEQANIAHCSLDHRTFPERQFFDAALAKVIDEYQPDVILLAGFMRILTTDFIAKYRGKLLNIHPSLLPKYRGLNTHQKALQNRDKFHGSSVHFVTEELDGGPLIAQIKLELSSFLENPEEKHLQQAVQQLEHKLYPQVVEWFLQERLSMQDNFAYLDGNKLTKPLVFDAEETIEVN